MKTAQVHAADSDRWN